MGTMVEALNEVEFRYMKDASDVASSTTTSQAFFSIADVLPIVYELVAKYISGFDLLALELTCSKAVMARMRRARIRSFWIGPCLTPTWQVSGFSALSQFRHLSSITLHNSTLQIMKRGPEIFNHFPSTLRSISLRIPVKFGQWILIKYPEAYRDKRREKACRTRKEVMVNLDRATLVLHSTPQHYRLAEQFPHLESLVIFGGVHHHRRALHVDRVVKETSIMRFLSSLPKNCLRKLNISGIPVKTWVEVFQAEKMAIKAEEEMMAMKLLPSLASGLDHEVPSRSSLSLNDVSAIVPTRVIPRGKKGKRTKQLLSANFAHLMTPSPLPSTATSSPSTATSSVESSSSHSSSSILSILPSSSSSSSPSSSFPSSFYQYLPLRELVLSSSEEEIFHDALHYLPSQLSHLELDFAHCSMPSHANNFDYYDFFDHLPQSLTSMKWTMASTTVDPSNWIANSNFCTHPNLTKLSIEFTCVSLTEHFLRKLPVGLLELDICNFGGSNRGIASSIASLPPSLRTFNCNISWPQNLPYAPQHGLDELPSSLTALTLGARFPFYNNLFFALLPRSLSSLRLHISPICFPFHECHSFCARSCELLHSHLAALGTPHHTSLTTDQKERLQSSIHGLTQEEALIALGRLKEPVSSHPTTNHPNAAERDEISDENIVENIEPNPAESTSHAPDHHAITSSTTTVISSTTTMISSTTTMISSTTTMISSTAAVTPQLNFDAILAAVLSTPATTDFPFRSLHDSASRLLPRYITHLDLPSSSFGPRFFDFLPTKLTSLSFETDRVFSSSSLAHLPSSLLSLTISNSPRISAGSLSQLPSGLTSLSVDDASFVLSPEQIVNSTWKDIHLIGDELFEHLPASLTSLQFSSGYALSNRAILYSPPALTNLSLKLSSQLTSECLPFLPRSLSNFQLDKIILPNPRPSKAELILAVPLAINAAVLPWVTPKQRKIDFDSIQ